MDFTDALTAEELWGWSVEVLDHLQTLRQQAHQGTITLDEWRKQDSAARIGLPTIDVAGVKEFQKALILDPRREIPWDESLRIVGLLTGLTSPAPSDEKLWEELAAIEQELNEPSHRSSDTEAYRERQQLIARWLTRPEAGIDAVSGLPWSEIGRYRDVHDPHLGPVPQYIEIARKLAANATSPANRQRATLIRNASNWPAAKTSFAEMYQEQLTWLPRLLLDAVPTNDDLQPILAEQLRIWSDPHVQQLLMRETASGWPPPYGDPNGHESPQEGKS